MKFSRWVRRFRFAWQFQPLTFHFLVLVLFYFFISYYTKNTTLDTSSFIGLILLMVKIIFVFGSVVVAFCLLTALFCYLWFFIKQRKHSPAITITMELDPFQENDLRIHTQLPFALRPFLGYVKVKLLYDKHELTDAYQIDKKKKGQWFFFQQGLESHNELYLPDYKEYHFDRAFIFFEDALHLFSFALLTPIHQNVQNVPRSFKQETDMPIPKQTEEEKVRIEQLRKVEGEYLNYKKFENSDDVRRIVWKIFAKNKELVVRIPEIMDPFSSHVYMYASFYYPLKIPLFPTFHSAMLNFYKRWVWTIYEAMAKKDIDIRYIPDQLVAGSQQHVLQEITLSNWHTEQSLTGYFKPAKASILCIHSFTPLPELEQLLSSIDQQTIIYVVRLSQSLKSYYLFNWIGRIFFLPKRDELARLKNKWPLHPLKHQALSHEKKLIQRLKANDCNFEILS